MPRHFHSGRSQWHSADSETAHALGLCRENALDVSDRNMTFKSNPVDERRVARLQRRGYAEPLLKCSPIYIVDHFDRSAKRRFDLSCPFKTATATGVAVHNHFGRGDYRQCPRP